MDACVRDGIRQLVILGAGYDSRAYRIDSLRRQVTIFELDHPDTQRRKLEKLVEILGTLPPSVRYVPIDFSAQALGEELDRNGYDRSAKTLFIWEGVTYYLDGPAIDGTLAFVRDCSGKGSSVIFDYTYADVINGTCDRTEAKRWIEQVRQVGEPLSFGFERGTVEKFLEQRGFTRAHNADGVWIDNAYFAGLSEKRSMTPIFAIVHARPEPRTPLLHERGLGSISRPVGTRPDNAGGSESAPDPIRDGNRPTGVISPGRGPMPARSARETIGFPSAAASHEEPAGGGRIELVPSGPELCQVGKEHEGSAAQAGPA